MNGDKTMAGNAKSIAKVWAAIDAALATQSPKAAAQLRGPATDKALTTLEKKLRVPLSDELRAYLRIHDGQDQKKWVSVVFLTTTWMLLPAASFVSSYEEQNELQADGTFADFEATNRDGLVRAAWWSDQWIPFAVNAGGDLMCVDMGPTTKGKAGQLVWWFHDEDFRNREFPDLTTFFQEYADALTKKKLTVRPDGGLVGEI